MDHDQPQMNDDEDFSFDGELDPARARLRKLAEEAEDRFSAKDLNLLSYTIAVHLDVRVNNEGRAQRISAELRAERNKGRRNTRGKI